MENMLKQYNAKVIRFENHLEIIRYGCSRIRTASHQLSEGIQIYEDNRDNDERKQRVIEQVFRIKRKIKYYCLSNDFDLFWTLTLDDTKVDSKDYVYSRKRLQAWLKYQREKYGKFDYIFVPELHKSGRIHFHGVTGRLMPQLVEARSPNSNRLIKKSGIQIYNAENWQNGYSTVSEIQSKERTSSYISKYITKELVETPSAFHQPRYFVSRGLKQPTISYNQLSDVELEKFIPSFVVGKKNATTNQFEADVSIYQIDILENGKMIQHIPPETIWKFKKKSPDGNQD